jgi:small subunit ribosomal protein S21e
MQNDKGEYIDAYIPRKCSASNRIISARDYASIQVNIVDIDPVSGIMTDKCKTYALCGAVRQMVILINSFEIICLNKEIFCFKGRIR